MQMQVAVDFSTWLYNQATKYNQATRQYSNTA